MMSGLNIANLKTIPWHAPSTLLFYEPNLTKQMATFLGCSTRRGYLHGRWNDYKGFYGSKAIYLGEEGPAGGKLQWSLHVNATAAIPTTARMAPPLTDSVVQIFQNQLLGHRLKNLIKVENSTFDASALPADIRPVANALGACVVGSPKLQNELISLLAAGRAAARGSGEQPGRDDHRSHSVSCPYGELEASRRRDRHRGEHHFKGA
jgi:hypothetical protein